MTENMKKMTELIADGIQPKNQAVTLGHAKTAIRKNGGSGTMNTVAGPAQPVVKYK